MNLIEEKRVLEARLQAAIEKKALEARLRAAEDQDLDLLHLASLWLINLPGQNKDFIFNYLETNRLIAANITTVLQSREEIYLNTISDQDLAKKGIIKHGDVCRFPLFYSYDLGMTHQTIIDCIKDEVGFENLGVMDDESVYQTNSWQLGIKTIRDQTTNLYQVSVSLRPRKDARLEQVLANERIKKDIGLYSQLCDPKLIVPRLFNSANGHKPQPGKIEITTGAKSNSLVMMIKGIVENGNYSYAGSVDDQIRIIETYRVNSQDMNTLTVFECTQGKKFILALRKQRQEIILEAYKPVEPPPKTTPSAITSYNQLFAVSQFG